MINQKFSLTRNESTQQNGLQPMSSIQKNGWDDGGNGGSRRRFWGHEIRPDVGGSSPLGGMTTIDTDTYYVFWIGVNTSYSAPYSDGSDFI